MGQYGESGALESELELEFEHDQYNGQQRTEDSTV